MNKLILPLIALLLASCASITPGNDPLLVSAERTTSLAYTTFDSFFALERAQETYVKANLPAVHAFANSLRKRAPVILTTTRTATETYRLNRNAENKATLQTAAALLQSALNQVQTYTLNIQSNTTP